MKYRIKLYIAFFVIAFASSLLAISILYTETKKRLFLELQNKVTTVAATTAALIDGDALGQIRGVEDSASPAFKTIRDELRNARDANRRKNIFIKFLYTVRPSPEDPKTFLFLVYSEADPETLKLYGNVDIRFSSELITGHLKEVYSPGKLVTDPWGTWLSGFAPVYDSAGKYVGTVGADISARDVMSDLNLFLWYALSALLAAVVLGVIIAHFLSKQVTQSLASLCDTVHEIGKGNLLCKSPLETHDEFQALATAINEMTEGLKERDKLKQNFSKYVSSFVLEKILRSDTALKLEGERRRITLLFADIRHFTLLSEKLPPEYVVTLLNEYFAIMLHVIFKHQGTLDKFLGDGIMVEFGAPLDDPNQEDNAVKTAIAMQQELSALCQRWEQERKPKIEIGIGIHTGHAVVGNIGSEERIEYTAIGDAVNVASRLEQATKALKVPILISETTYEGLKDKALFRSLGPLSLPGRESPITVYTYAEKNA